MLVSDNDKQRLRVVPSDEADLARAISIVLAETTSEQVTRLLEVIGAQNSHLIIHLCGELDEAGQVKECNEYDVPTNVHLFLIQACRVLRNKMIDEEKNPQ